MSKLSEGRKFLVVMVAIVVIAAAFLVTSTTLEAMSISNCTYYSNPTYTTIVGQFGYDCCNNPVHWGVKTKWSVCGGCFACFPPGPQ